MTEQEQQRLVNHRLAVIRHAEEVTGNVAQTCRYFGIARQTFYRWLCRHEERGWRVCVTGRHAGATNGPRLRMATAKGSLEHQHEDGDDETVGDEEVLDEPFGRFDPGPGRPC